MAKKTAPLLPATDELLRRFGERLRLARQRRRVTAKQVAERAGMSPITLRSLERGGAGVTMGAYLAVMQVLGIEKDLDLLGTEDPVGRQLQDARLPSRVKASTSVSTVQTSERIDRPDEIHGRPTKKSRPANGEEDWIEKGGFASADDLARLIETLPAPRTKKAR
jgi:transcriptional regulator with XRE-family HTH domain